MWMNEWNENNNKKICIEWLYTFIIFIIIVFFRNFLFCYFPRFRSDGLPDEERARGTIVNWGLGVVGLCLVEWHSNKNNEIKYDFFAAALPLPLPLLLSFMAIPASRSAPWPCPAISYPRSNSKWLDCMLICIYSFIVTKRHKLNSLMNLEVARICTEALRRMMDLEVMEEWRMKGSF